MIKYMVLLGLIMIYTTAHLLFLQGTSYEARTEYQKIVTWVGGISIALLFLGTMVGN